MQLGRVRALGETYSTRTTEDHLSVWISILRIGIEGKILTEAATPAKPKNGAYVGQVDMRV